MGFMQMVANQQSNSVGFSSSQGGDRKSSSYTASQSVQQSLTAANGT